MQRKIKQQLHLAAESSIQFASASVVNLALTCAGIDVQTKFFFAIKSLDSIARRESRQIQVYIDNWNG
jgi:hypothetical protein